MYRTAMDASSQGDSCSAPAQLSALHDMLTDAALESEPASFTFTEATSIRDILYIDRYIWRFRVILFLALTPPTALAPPNKYHE